MGPASNSDRDQRRRRDPKSQPSGFSSELRSSSESRTPSPERRQESPNMPPQFIYTMKGLGKVHPPDHVVLKDIWLSFLPGAKIGVLGLNGSGKSSLLRIMAGEDQQFLGEAFQ